MFWKLFLICHMYFESQKGLSSFYFLFSSCFESCSCFDPEGHWNMLHQMLHGPPGTQHVVKGGCIMLNICREPEGCQFCGIIMNNIYAFLKMILFWKPCLSCHLLVETIRSLMPHSIYAVVISALLTLRQIDLFWKVPSTSHTRIDLLWTLCLLCHLLVRTRRSFRVYYISSY